MPEQEEGSDVGQLLAELAGRAVPVSEARSVLHRAWADMAVHNARLAVVARNQASAQQEQRLLALQQVLALPDAIRRIECFDVSHTQGEAAVASCVVYQGNGMKKADYRRFNIRNIEPGDDYAAMRQAVSRRYERVAGGESMAPDLILIDGGKGQVACAHAALAELGLGELAMIGVAKGEGRKPGLETLVFPDAREPLQLSAEHPALHLIQEYSATKRIALPSPAIGHGAARHAGLQSLKICRASVQPAARLWSRVLAAWPVSLQHRRTNWPKFPESAGDRPKRYSQPYTEPMPFNLPILLTWLRIVAIPLLIAVYYLPAGWVAGHERDVAATSLFIAAAVTDWADGFLARRLNQTSAFGAFLDPVADKLMVAAALIVLVQLGRADAIVAAIIIGREITISALREWMARIWCFEERGGIDAGKGQDRRADGRNSDAALLRGIPGD